MSSVIQEPQASLEVPEAPEAVEPQIQSKRGEPTWEIAYLFPRQGEWTETDYLALNTNRLVELSDGCLEFLTMPVPFHQFIVAYLYELLKTWVAAHSLGHVFFAPLPIRLWTGKMREPDVVYLRPDRLQDVHRPPTGADLVVEVVSPREEDRKRDLKTKRDEYARAGIDEYWIVDPQEQRITVLVREGQTYREHGVFAPGQQATSVLLPGFAVDVAAAFAAGQAQP